VARLAPSVEVINRLRAYETDAYYDELVEMEFKNGDKVLGTAFEWAGNGPKLYVTPDTTLPATHLIGHNFGVAITYVYHHNDANSGVYGLEQGDSNLLKDGRIIREKGGRGTRLRVYASGR
jgi:hypothetical protein